VCPGKNGKLLCNSFNAGSKSPTLGVCDDEDMTNATIQCFVCCRVFCDFGSDGTDVSE
jgi:hypothetical protein